MRRSILILALVWLSTLALFFLEMRGYFRNGILLGKTPVAKLEESQGSVRRLVQGFFTWDRIYRDDRISAGDAVATSEESYARLRLFSGGELNLDPGSMIVLRNDPTEMTLHVLVNSGKVQIAQDPKTTQTKVKIVPALRPASKHPIESRLAPVVEAQKIRNLGKELSMKGKVASVLRLLPALELSFPAEGAVIDTRITKVTRFEWKLPEDVPPDYKRSMRYEFSLRPMSSGKNDQTRTIAADKTSLAVSSLSEGRYIWSVRAISPRGYKGPESAVRVIEIRPSILKKPTPPEPALEKPKLLAPRKRDAR